MNSRVELRHESSENSCFRILPSFKYQQESQGYIYDEDLVFFMSTIDTNQRLLGEPYLNVSRSISGIKFFLNCINI